MDCQSNIVERGGMKKVLRWGEREEFTKWRMVRRGMKGSERRRKGGG